MASASIDRGRGRRPSRRRGGAAAARHCRTPSPTASASAPGRRSRSRARAAAASCRPSASRSRRRSASPRPAMMRSTVDLPQPEGPSRLRNSPLADVERHVAQRHACRWRRSWRRRCSDDQRPAAAAWRGARRGRPVTVARGGGRGTLVFGPVADRRGEPWPARRRRVSYFLRSMPTPLQTNSVV